ncbi:MAG TPA: ATP-binding cassette domain-containing protein [Streptosporangiaceae bacterium]|nr:ATP-binding cassette domain-containing protein [Streptosporangiaceae bacterium]
MRGRRNRSAGAGSATASPGSPPPLLQVSGLSKAFGGNKAVGGVSLGIRPGQALGLVGPNGSGKTTLINLVSGVYRPDGGSVMLNGHPVTGFASHRLCKLGLNRTFQIPRPLGDLRVADNLAVVRRHHQPLFEADPLEFVGLSHAAGRRASSLTSGEQKLLDLARALAAGPRVLLVDELGAGLGQADLDFAAGLLRRLKEAGLALLVVEHLMGFLEQVVDSVVVLNAGLPIFGGTLRAAIADQRVIDVFLGD